MQIESLLTLFDAWNPSAIRIFRACKGLTVPLITGTGPAARCLCHGMGRRDLHSSCGRHLGRRVQSPAVRGKRVPAVAHGGFDVTKVRPGPEFRALQGS